MAQSARQLRIEGHLDELLKLHIGLILSYAERNTIEELHARYLGDPVFELFGLTSQSFTKRRWTAGFANSCATNLGRFTDKATKAILVDAFGLPAEQILKKVKIRSNNKTEIEETDGIILASEVPSALRGRVETVAKRLSQKLAKPFDAKGVGFELRGRYGKNDDTLIQKDEHMADAIRALGAVPILGTFSIANAPGAITRLSRSWLILAGQETVDVLTELTEFDLIKYLKSRSKLLKPVVDLLSTD